VALPIKSVFATPGRPPLFHVIWDACCGVGSCPLMKTMKDTACPIAHVVGPPIVRVTGVWVGVSVGVGVRVGVVIGIIRAVKGVAKGVGDALNDDAPWVVLVVVLATDVLVAFAGNVAVAAFGDWLVVLAVQPAIDTDASTTMATSTKTLFINPPKTIIACKAI